MILNTIKSGANSNSKLAGVRTSVACPIQSSQILGNFRDNGAVQLDASCRAMHKLQAHALCNIQGHSPWRLNLDSHKNSLLSSIQMQRKNSSFSLSRKIQNEIGFKTRIRHEFGEVNQGMYTAAFSAEAVPITG